MLPASFPSKLTLPYCGKAGRGRRAMVKFSFVGSAVLRGLNEIFPLIQLLWPDIHHPVTSWLVLMAH